MDTNIPAPSRYDISEVEDTSSSVSSTSDEHREKGIWCRIPLNKIFTGDFICFELAGSSGLKQKEVTDKRLDEGVKTEEETYLHEKNHQQSAQHRRLQRRKNKRTRRRAFPGNDEKDASTK